MGYYENKGKGIEMGESRQKTCSIIFDSERAKKALSLSGLWTT